MSYGSRYSCSIALQGPSSSSPSLKVTVPLFTLRGQLMLNEALLKACARSLTFCAHNPFTLLLAASPWQMMSKRDFFHGLEQWTKSSPENEAGKSRGILLMLQGDLR